MVFQNAAEADEFTEQRDQRTGRTGNQQRGQQAHPLAGGKIVGNEGTGRHGRTVGKVGEFQNIED